jgi:NTE family protein
MLALAVSLLLASCSSFYKAQNAPLKAYQEGAAYRTAYFNQIHDIEENLIILAFSGGGTRAAALSYGVLQELSATPYTDDSGTERTLLSDVDFISAVSGGSFTAAYYGLFGDRIFEDFEKKFLHKSIESALISNMLNPLYWVRSLSSGFDRTEMAIEFYDNTIFDRKTFADIPLADRPFIVINATDLSQGRRFAFDQDNFDLLCSDISSFPVSRAVTASSAVPFVFPSVVLENRAGDCMAKLPKEQRPELSSDVSNTKQSEYFKAVEKYGDSKKKQYIHLVDGGLTDNLGLRAISDHMDIKGIDSDPNDENTVKRVAVILVNSAVKPARSMDTSTDTPPLSETLEAFTDTLIQNMSLDTKSYFFDDKGNFKQQISSRDAGIEFFITEVSFEAIEEEASRQLFNRLPTSLELEEEQVDAVIAAGRALLRKDAEFIEFKASLKQSP